MGGVITTNSIWINAFGSIGSKEDPLGIYAYGTIRLKTVKGLIFYRNLFKAHYGIGRRGSWRATTLRCSS